MDDSVRFRLEGWKRQLIDLSSRNRLLSFKPTRVTTVRIVDEMPAEVFRSLHLENRSMRFLPLKEQAGHKNRITSETGASETGASTSEQVLTEPVEFHPVERESLSSHHTDTLLQTELQEAKLDYSLLRIYQNSTSLLEEQGVNTLFLALGMIEWLESPDATAPLKAPLILLPVHLSRQTARSGFSVKATQDDPILNPAIAERLRLDFRIALPQLPDTFEDFDPGQFFASVQQSIASQKNWRVTNDIHLGLFTFQKFVMYKDLEINEAHYADHAVIQALCAGRNERLGQLPEEVLRADLDEALPPETTFQVLDADSSQQRAILAVKSGRDLVLEGPPGTGKSQTIANLIADALADGKRVLFVSEKMAALEVVYNRLESLGLHDFCLNLHSNKTNKRAVIEELARVLNNPPRRDHNDDAGLDRLAEVRRDLNGYVRDLHEPFGKFAASPFLIFGKIAQLEAAPVVNAWIDEIGNCDKTTFDQTCRDFLEHASLLEEIGDPSRHAWRGSELQSLSGAERDLMSEAIDRAAGSLWKLIEVSKAYASEIGTTRPSTFGQVESLCEVAVLIARSPQTTEAIVSGHYWTSLSREAGEILEHGRLFEDKRAAVLRNFKTELLETGFSDLTELLQMDFSQLLSRYAEYCRTWGRFFNPAFWRDRKALRFYFREDYSPSSNEQLLKDLDVALQCRAEVLFLRERDRAGRELFGDRWLGSESDWRDLESFSDWIVKVRRFLADGFLESEGVRLAAGGQLNPDDVQIRVDEIRAHLSAARADVERVAKLGVFNPTGNVSTEAEAGLIPLAERLAELKEAIPGLRQWSLYQASLKRCEAGVGAAFLKRFYEQAIEPDEMEPAFRRLFYRRWLDLVCSERPRLEKFRALSHEKKIEEFKRLDLRALDLARRRVLHQLSRKKDELIGDGRLSPELVLVQRESRKKTRHLPLRKLLLRAPEAVRTIKPCFMMSPLSVAQFLDPSLHIFDLVIFDEASQIPPEDALGAIIRGRQVVVVGDSKQLPPTSFFSAQIIAEDDIDPSQGEAPAITDSVESILDEMASLGFARLRLRWHYRSRHESLITFSNRKFYDAELITFPGPGIDADRVGLQFHWVGGVYEGKGINSVEASAVADAVCEHIRNCPELTLGVGTFNIRQQTLILDELDKRRREDPALEFFFARRGEGQFFVKNLENIQGDDRDVIFISVTYGPDSEGRVRYNFGPLNGPNGWRRLNVIITRAKLSLRIFSSLRGEDIDPARAQSEGAQLLREYLFFAERGILSAPTLRAEAEMESPFEQSVYEELTRQGLRLAPQIGQSGYRIDFGVQDEEMPGRFIAGIECDGAAYHSAATARDRDRLRQSVLENLGWKIHRIWSTDWYQSREAQITRILNLVEQSRREAGQEELSQTAPEQKPDARSIEIEEFDPDPNDPVVEPTSFTPDGKTAPQGFLPEIESYNLTPIRILGEAESFYSEPDSRIAETLLRVVECESPVHIIEATRRVAVHWQMNRAGNRIRERIYKIAGELNRSGKLRLQGDFLWKAGQKEAVIRARAIRDYVFDAEYICPSEFEAAIIYVLKSGGARMLDELVTEVARAMGFDRTGRKLSGQISSAIQALVAQGKLRAVARGIQLRDEGSGMKKSLRKNSD